MHSTSSSGPSLLICGRQLLAAAHSQPPGEAELDPSHSGTGVGRTILIYRTLHTEKIYLYLPAPTGELNQLEFM